MRFFANAGAKSTREDDAFHDAGLPWSSRRLNNSWLTGVFLKSDAIQSQDTANSWNRHPLDIREYKLWPAGGGLGGPCGSRAGIGSLIRGCTKLTRWIRPRSVRSRMRTWARNEVPALTISAVRTGARQVNPQAWRQPTIAASNIIQRIAWLLNVTKSRPSGNASQSGWTNAVGSEKQFGTLSFIRGSEFLLPSGQASAPFARSRLQRYSQCRRTFSEDGIRR